MSLRLCQLKSLALSLLILTSCSSPKRDLEIIEDEPILLLESNWFKTNPEHALLDHQGQPVSHLFFDVSPEFTKYGNLVNAVVVTPQNSEYAYQLDLPSGQRTFSHAYCEQRDVWKEDSGTTKHPPYSVAFIPRMLDQLGDPQTVLIWGDPKKMRESLDRHTVRIRLIGAFIQKECPEANCVGKTNWLSRLVYIGIDPVDGRYKNVKDIERFKKVIDWEGVKAHIHNIDGRNFLADKMYPAKKVGHTVNLLQAMKFSGSRSIFMTDQETKKIQAGCHALYDRLWTEVAVERPEDRSPKTTAESMERDKLIKSIKAKNLPAGFAQRFHAFTKKYYDEALVCAKFVYSGNLNQNREKFWFTSYVKAFYLLNGAGYYFDCNNQSWRQNLRSPEGERDFQIKVDLRSCDERDLDLAMSYIPNFTAGLKSAGTPDYYRFVDYDNHRFGTHRKLYSWVKMETKKFDCEEDPNPKIIQTLTTFPEEVEWKRRQVQDVNIRDKNIL